MTEIERAGDLSQLPVESLKGVGPSLKNKLLKIGISTVEDVIFHLPLRYEDRTRISSIGSVMPGRAYLLEGIITQIKIMYGRRRSLLAILEDPTGKIGLRFYYFSKRQQENLKHLQKVRCYGEVRQGSTGIEIYHPEYSEANIQRKESKNLTPVYPSTEGITQNSHRKIAKEALSRLRMFPLEELTPTNTSTSLTESLFYLHQPPADADIDLLNEGEHATQKALSLDELTAHQVRIKLLREELRNLRSPQLSDPSSLYEKAIDSFDFQLTNAQKLVSREISTDMLKDFPMHRLVQGDVGSGKTVLAALAAVHAHENELQTALMAPTELLAEQHLATLETWLRPLGVNVCLLTSSVRGTERERLLKKIGNGEANLAVGTHALFQREVSFKNLGLVIIDEQHRFGVNQRLALRKKGAGKNSSPHQVIMTATPIPRTLSMGFHTEMDVSILDELPPGRLPIKTSVLSSDRRDDIIAQVNFACQAGRQAYWVCTLINESDSLECEAAEKVTSELREKLPKVSIGLVHGQLPSQEKNRIMQEFKKGVLDLLVCTTVIEVGVDVPNASLMIIENSERLGLAQLHQLRGRVGRGNEASHCLLLYKKPIGAIGRQRLDVMRNSNDGFFIAEKDLEMRGPGEVFGTLQSGELRLRIADLQRDKRIAAKSREVARQLLIKNKGKAKKLVNRWISNEDKINLA
ncbi:ATP-dependent DNA helicase RecG [Gammaproteobacteria bacterium]|nr:ATP-dependent DNA helicase RecG [Gammaproteobacteria bacterium]